MNRILKTIKKININKANAFTEKNTHFGFKKIKEEEKESLVAQVFSSVAKNYDVMNDFMSMGVHRVWKDYLIQNMAPGPNTTLLDVAGGTGDIALRFLNYCKTMHNDTTSKVKVVDINPNMLAHGKDRYLKSEFSRNGQAEFMLGNAENLENIEDSSVDVYTISFGIRNCTHVDKVIAEAYRVLKPGGRLMVLEFSKVNTPLIKEFYDMYSFNVIPEIGRVVANDRESYQYLVESIRQFPDQVTFANMIKAAGFSIVDEGYENLTFGVAAIHTGYKF
ncbi:ubiquinone/menaquinone [Neoconidiobolus thromboides FSU 785]|nr:ubiquinone/menaquinone [Neoconidiobolus thromboides FSU 785]